MRIGVVSQSPTVATGLGVVCNHIVQSLLLGGHTVSSFAIEARVDASNSFERAYKLVSIASLDDVSYMLPHFLQHEDPDLLIISSDIVAVHKWFALVRDLDWKRPVIVQFVLDGIPFDPEFLELLPSAAGRLTPAFTVANYLTRIGIPNVDVCSYGVDPSVFRPLPNRDQLRRLAGLDGKFVIGVFGRNVERKQQPRVLMALAHLRALGLASDVVLYLHCQPKDDPKLGGWNLQNVARELKVEDLVLFPNDNFDQLRGVPYLGVNRIESESYRPQNSSIPNYYSYIDRINCCDMIINTAFCGGFELGIIEAQACGVPIAVTNDGGIMAEISGQGALLLEAADIGVWKTGARQFFVSPEVVAQAIMSVRTDASLSKELIRNGMHNAANYNWGNFREGVLKAVNRV